MKDRSKEAAGVFSKTKNQGKVLEKQFAVNRDNSYAPHYRCRKKGRRSGLSLNEGFADHIPITAFGFGNKEDAIPMEEVVSQERLTPWKTCTHKPMSMKENISAVHVELTPEDLREIDAGAVQIQIQGARLPEAVLKLTGG
jgi:hypothetical protein